MKETDDPSIAFLAAVPHVYLSSNCNTSNVVMAARVPVAVECVGKKDVMVDG